MRVHMVPAAELVEDFDLYPREDVDSHQITRLVQALEAGQELPPILACRKTKRIVDGFHRRRAYVRWQGDGVMVPVVWKDYRNDAELFKEATLSNSMHGLRLDSQSRTRVTIIAKRLGISLEDQAVMLRITTEAVREIAVKVVVSSATREPIPIKPVCEHLRGQKITKAQEEALSHFGGLNLPATITQLRHAVEGKLFDENNPKHLKALRDLAELIFRVVPEPVAA